MICLNVKLNSYFLGFGLMLLQRCRQDQELEYKRSIVSCVGVDMELWSCFVRAQQTCRQCLTMLYCNNQKCLYQTFRALSTIYLSIKAGFKDLS